jgi:hypothetical protein
MVVERFPLASDCGGWSWCLCSEPAYRPSRVASQIGFNRLKFGLIDVVRYALNFALPATIRGAAALARHNPGLRDKR